jgi:hypothetical protein
MPFWFELIILMKAFDMIDHEFIHYLLGTQIIYDRKFNWNLFVT